jgi:uncharacterized protein (AIM24 family)
MAVTINASTTSGLIQSADTSGQINLQSNGTTVLGVTSSGSTVTGTQSVSGDLSFNSGYGSAAVAYGCRAWVNFNGQGTVAIRASGNVSSITDNGTGDYTINFTTAMPDTNYAVTACAGGVSETGPGTKFWINVSNNTDSQAPTTSGVRIGCGYSDTIYVGCSRMHIAIFR